MKKTECEAWEEIWENHIGSVAWSSCGLCNRIFPIINSVAHYRCDCKIIKMEITNGINKNGQFKKKDYKRKDI